jgi:hypothetical protein
MLNDLNFYLFYIPGEFSEQSDQDKVVEILDQAKATYHQWHEARVDSMIFLNYIMRNLFLILVI